MVAPGISGAVRRVLAFAALTFGLMSCTFLDYPAGVTSQDDRPTFMLKPCDRTTVIGRAVLRQSESEEQSPKWEARLEPNAGGGQDIPLAESVPGYTIDGDLGSTSLVPDNYYLVELYDRGGERLATMVFKGSEPVEGKVLVYSDSEFGEATYADRAAWEADTFDCPGEADADARTLLRGVGIGLGIVVLIGVTIAVVATVTSRRRRARAPARVAAGLSGATRPCPNGHPVSVSNRFCPVC
jgi:hypothetical protein